MNSFSVILFAALWGCLAGVSATQSDTLKLVHVLFRHGNRNPGQSALIAGSKYYNESNYPEGYDQLTNKGKQTEYSLGSALRNRYDSFLTNTWRINYLEPVSTNMNRTKMSLELVLAALYPPRGSLIWSLLFWLPIPYNYGTKNKEIYWFGSCSNFNTLFKEAQNTTEALAYLQKYEEAFSILELKSNKNIDSLMTAFGFYTGFLIQEQLGFELDPWVSAIYPEPLHSAAVDMYYFQTKTTALKRIAAGFLLKNILKDTAAKINGTLEPTERKMFLYSAHEMNVATMLLSLGVVEITDLPPYGSYILFEVHEISGIWGIKLFYQFYEETDPIALKLPGCDYFCPYDTFYSLVEEILPESDTECTG